MTEDRQGLPLPRVPQSGTAPRLQPERTDPLEPVVEAIAGGLIMRSQDVIAGGLHQAVDLRRPDGSVWRAYERIIALPAGTADIASMIREASQVLALAAGAVAAADTARIARGATMVVEAAPWRCTYAPRVR